jgi:hypothetical protein
MIFGGPAAKESGDDDVFDLFPHCCVAEETGHADEQLAQQGHGFPAILAQDVHVLGECLELANGQAAAQTAQGRGALVIREVVAGAVAQQREDLGQRLLVVFGAVVDRRRRGENFVAVRQNPAGDQGRGQDEVDQARRDRVARHLFELRLRGVLDDHEPVVFLHPPHSHRAVRTRPGEDHADRTRPVRAGKRAEERVDRGAALLETRRRRRNEHAVLHGQAAVRRDDVDVIGDDAHGVVHLGDRNAGRALQHVREPAFGRRRRMKDDHVRQAAVGRHVSKKLLERRDRTFRRADPGDQKIRLRLRLSRSTAALRHRGLSRDLAR